MAISDIILIVVLHSAAFGAAGYFIGAQREMGALPGAFLCLLLGIIGLIVVLVSPRKNPMRIFDELQRYKTWFENGNITETEYENLKGRLFEQR
jgi:hypothetical protein